MLMLMLVCLVGWFLNVLVNNLRIIKDKESKKYSLFVIQLHTTTCLRSLRTYQGIKHVVIESAEVPVQSYNLGQYVGRLDGWTGEGFPGVVVEGEL